MTSNEPYRPPRHLDGGVCYEPLDQSDWRTWRELRLRALADAPYAFTSTLSRALSKDTEGYWRGYFPSTGRCFVARIDRQTLGMARVVVGQQTASVPMLVSLWVDPTIRGKGVAASLVRTCTDWVHAHLPGQPVRLEVNANNLAAIALYEKLGFTAVTGDTADEHDITYELRSGADLNL